MLRVVENEKNQELLEYVRGLLERCESGEVVSMTCFEQLRGGEYRIYGSPTENRHETAGMLLEAAMSRLP